MTTACRRNTSIPRGVHINVQEGERVRSGDTLMDGPRNPHDILVVLGEKELQKYVVNEMAAFLLRVPVYDFGTDDSRYEIITSTFAFRRCRGKRFTR